MKRRLLALGFLVLLAALAYGASTVGLWTTNIGDVTIDSVYTGNWEPAGSLIVNAQDTGYFHVVVTGIAYMNPYSELYIGLGNDSANRVDSATGATTGQTHTNLDTMVYRYDFMDRTTTYANNYVPFMYQYVQTVGTPGDSLIDTIYLNVATGTEDTKIDLKDVVMTATFFGQQK